MEQHPVEDGLLWMTRTVEPGHIVNEESRNAPGTGSRADSRDSVKNRERFLTQAMNLRTAQEIEKHLIERLLVKMQAKVDPAVHYLFRLAKYDEGNADEWLLRTVRPTRPVLLITRISG